jgi:hypothetical protein
MTGILAACSRSEGETLLQERCAASCHEKSEIVAVGRTRDEWSQKIDQMIVFGAELSDEERETLLDYLAENYGP